MSTCQPIAFSPTFFKHSAKSILKQFSVTPQCPTQDSGHTDKEPPLDFESVEQLPRISILKGDAVVEFWTSAVSVRLKALL